MKKIDFPCLNVRMVPTDKVVANDYNPNKVASPEMKLLAHSIEMDGLTMPIVTFHDKDTDTYIIVDGFHRYTILRDWFKCPEIAVSVIDKPLAERMASTERHNKAKGKHSIELEAALIRRLMDLGWNDQQIAKHLGKPAEEVLRLKQVIGLPGLFRGQAYSRSWTRPDGEDWEDGEAQDEDDEEEETV